MSDTAYYENQYEAAPQSGRWKSVIGSFAAAVLSLAMLGGVVAWAYQISVRDAHDVPIVRAIDGPTKQRPEETGGLKLAEKDNAVTRMVSGEGGGGAATLAPGGAQLAPEDKPVEVIRHQIADANAPPRATTVERLQTADAGDEGVKVASAMTPGPATPEQTAPAPEIGSSTGTPVQAIGDETAVTRQAPDQSPPVRKRPETLDTSGAVATTTNTPVARQDIALGDPVVQLGAFGSRQIAERVWKDQLVVNSRLFSGLNANITTVQSGGRELYRLRVGPFASDDDAKKVCVVLKARGSDCIFTRSE